MHRHFYSPRNLCATFLVATSVLPITSRAFPASYGSSTVPTQCTPENTLVHKEWSALTSDERNDFTTSVQCLMNLPPKIPYSAAPGSRSRYDDFTATHINNTLLIHANGVFLPWHRHFLHLVQDALMDECGFTGALPYWNWVWWADDLAGSPLFDGSATSIGGDGYYNASLPAIPNGNYTFPRGNGGGCIREGPFTNITTGFRNFLNTEVLQTTMPIDALDYAPRCVRRDLNSAITRPNHQPDIIKKLLTAPTIQGFRHHMDYNAQNSSSTSPHRAGHWSVGPSMLDQFASPSDPAFYLHHSMIDNLWAQWQLQDPERRMYALDGTVTTLNNPPSQNATLDFVTSFGYLDEPKKLREIMTNFDGKYCHRYEYDQDAAKPCN